MPTNPDIVFTGLSSEARHESLILFENSDAMLISLTVGKVDAGVAVLLTEDKRLVGPPHFPIGYFGPPEEQLDLTCAS